MEKEVNLDIVKATQASLGKYVKRPPLTEKLLKKPPFRFLHDIITSVLKSTGFFDGLFDEEELISDNVKDRERKILFLNKIITVISTTTGKSLSVKPSKIIAGQEPDKTNELLQCLALALDNNLSSDEAVKLYKESVKLNTSSEKRSKDLSPIKKSTDARKVSSKSSNKSVKIVKSDKNGLKLKQRENTIVKKENQKKVSQPPKVSNKKVIETVKQTGNSIKTHDDHLTNANLGLTLDQNFELATIDIQDEINVTPKYNPDSNIEIYKDHSPSQEISVNDKQEQRSAIDHNIIEDNLSNDNGVILDSEHPENILEHKEQNTNLNNAVHAISSPRKIETENVLKKDEIPKLNEPNKDNIAQPQEAEVSDVSNTKRPSSVRPPSSRPGAPRLREKHDSIISSAENHVGGKVNIIAENTINEEEDESTIILMDNTNTLNNIQEENLHLQTSFDQHGHLVQQILDAQKEFTQAAGKTEIEWHFGAQKARDVLNQEIEKLRFNVQALSRVANPLGKLLDHIQEDVEVMRQELQQWTASYDHASKELLKQKVANEEYLLPLIARIKQLDVDIAEKHDKINDLKIIIHKNASRIDKLLSSGSLL